MMNATSEQMAALAIFTPNIRLSIELFYAATAAISVIGNLIVIYVLFVRQVFARATRLLIINLAASDLIMATLSIPFTYSDFIYLQWHFPLIFCPIVHFATITCLYVTVYTLCLIAIDRFNCICRPTRSNCVNTHCALWIGVVWVLGVSIGTIQVYHSTVKSVPLTDGTVIYDCRETWPSASARDFFTFAIFLTTYLSPCLCMMALYWRIVRQLFHHEANRQALTTAQMRSKQRKKKMVKLLITVMIMFQVCWTPIQLFHLILLVTGNSIVPKVKSAGYEVYAGIYLICHWLAMSNSCVNPLLYSFMSKRFRTDLSLAVKCQWIHDPWFSHGINKKAASNGAVGSLTSTPAFHLADLASFDDYGFVKRLKGKRQRRKRTTEESVFRHPLIEMRPPSSSLTIHGSSSFINHALVGPREALLVLPPGSDKAKLGNWLPTNRGHSSTNQYRDRLASISEPVAATQVSFVSLESSSDCVKYQFSNHEPLSARSMPFRRHNSNIVHEHIYHNPLFLIQGDEGISPTDELTRRNSF